VRAAAAAAAAQQVSSPSRSPWRSSSSTASQQQARDQGTAQAQAEAEAEGEADEGGETGATRDSDIIPPRHAKQQTQQHQRSHSKTVHMREGQSVSVAMMLAKPEQQDPGSKPSAGNEPQPQRDGSISASLLYYKNTLSDKWLAMAVVAHVIQWGILLAVAGPAMGSGAYGFNVLLVVLVVLLLVSARLLTRKRPRVSLADRLVLTPEDEADDVSSLAVHMLAAAALCEGIAYAVFTASVAGPANAALLHKEGFFSQNTVIQTLQFASITFLTFHRSVRPSNRCDPLRTMLELEVVSVCWDALDGSTIFMLLGQGGLGPAVDTGLRFLQAFWYLSVGVRTAYMYAVHLPPSSWLYKRLVTRPLELAQSPTVDRTLQSLRQRSVITLVMALAELYAMSIRIYLWSRGQVRVGVGVGVVVLGEGFRRR